MRALPSHFAEGNVGSNAGFGDPSLNVTHRRCDLRLVLRSQRRVARYDFHAFFVLPENGFERPEGRGKGGFGLRVDSGEKIVV